MPRCGGWWTASCPRVGHWMRAPVCRACALLVPPPVCTRYQTISPRKATRKIPPIASGRAGRSRVGLVLVGARRRGAVFGPDRGGAFEMGLGRGVFFAGGAPFRAVEYLCPFWSPPALQ